MEKQLNNNELTKNNATDYNSTSLTTSTNNVDNNGKNVDNCYAQWMYIKNECGKWGNEYLIKEQMNTDNQKQLT